LHLKNHLKNNIHIQKEILETLGKLEKQAQFWETGSPVTFPNNIMKY
jgi:hypothetical protein